MRFLTFLSLCHYHRHLWLDKLHPLLLPLAQTLPTQEIAKMETGGVDKVGCGKRLQHIISTDVNLKQAEFLQVNILIIITLVEIELVAATIPHHPWVRVCAMASPTICFYVGFLFCGSAILTQMHKTLPFNMSSTPKGSLWRPALFAFVEDAGALEGQGGVPYREAIMKRYAVSPRFRRMILIVDWMWGLGLLAIAVISTVLIMVLDRDIGFGIGWGLPWAFSAVYGLLTVRVVKYHLHREKTEWAMKEVTSSSMSIE